jgi:hypothetical protein
MDLLRDGCAPKSFRVLIEGGPVRRGQPGTAALRLKRLRVLLEGGPVRRGQGGPAALRLKSFRVWNRDASDRRGRTRTDALLTEPLQREPCQCS